MPNGKIENRASFDNTPDIGAIGSLAKNFDYNKASIKKESMEEVEYIYSMLKAFPKMKIELRGHTDSLNNTGDPDYNLKLSQKRADAVKEALLKMGIDESRIRAK